MEPLQEWWEKIRKDTTGNEAAGGSFRSDFWESCINSNEDGWAGKIEVAFGPSVLRRNGQAKSQNETYKRHSRLWSAAR